MAGVCFLLAAVVWAVYGQTLDHKFLNYDDDSYVYGNPQVLKGLTAQGILHAFTHKEIGLWNPLVTISHMLDYQFYGLWAGGHHLTNVLLHLASVLLLFLIWSRMTGAFWRSALVAALFAIHPLHVESVAWISERKDVLSGLFFMLTLGSYLHYVGRPDSRGRYLVLLLLFGCGLMSKVMLVTLPFLLLLLDYWPLKRLFEPCPPEKDSLIGIQVTWRVVGEKIPLIALSLVLCVVTLLGPKEAPIEPMPFLIRMGLVPVWLVLYLGQMVWPVGLAVIYPRPEESFPWWPAALTLWGLLSWGGFVLRKKHPYLWMGWLWNLGMLLPVLGILQISRHSQADHYNYLPKIGLYIALVWTAAEWAKEHRYRRAALKGGAIVALAALLPCAYHQASTWRDNITLWKHTITSTRDNFVAHNNLGNALLEQKQLDAAIAEYREAIRINPNAADVHYNLGSVLSEQKQMDAAIAEFRETLRINPDDAQAHHNLGNALFGQKQTDAAIAEYREAIRINPNDVPTHNNLGNALLEQKQPDAAITEYREAIRINPEYAIAHNNLGIVLLKQGQTDAAIAEFREILRINPNDVPAHNNLGNALFEQKQLDKAIAEYREAIRINPEYPDAHGNLGNCLLKKGRMDEALPHIEKALELQPADPVFKNSLAWTLATAAQPSFQDGLWAVQLATQASQSGGGNNAFFLRTLAAAHAQTGDFRKALSTAQEALQAARGQADQSLTNSLLEDIKLYKTGKPLRERP